MNLAIFRRDIPVLQGTVVVLASFFGGDPYRLHR